MNRNIVLELKHLADNFNEMNERLDRMMQMLNAEVNEKADTNSDGIDDLADVVSAQTEALDELATAITEMEGGE